MRFKIIKKAPITYFRLFDYRVRQKSPTTLSFNNFKTIVLFNKQFFPIANITLRLII